MISSLYFLCASIDRDRANPMEKTWLTRTVDFWNEWAIRIAASVSLAAHVLLMILAETRRRSVWPGLAFALWLVYQILDIAGSYALGHLSLDTTGDTDAAKHEQVLIAFWAPFLLLHLGGPDNVGAYSLDDDKHPGASLLGPSPRPWQPATSSTPRYSSPTAGSCPWHP